MSMLYSSDPSPYPLLCSNGSSSDCSPCVSTNLSALPSTILGTVPLSEDPRIENLRRYSYGVALPSICLLGIVGNIFNLIVLTRKNMRGTAYIYMRGTQMLEIFALEIQMFTEQKNNKKLKELYEKSLRVRSAVPHPLIMSVIRECGGKMHLRAGEFEKAYTDFFEAFKNYDESGNPRRLNCLKYLILNSMLMKSAINPFDSQEAKPYANDPEIKALTLLINAFQNNKMGDFVIIFEKNKESLMADPFIREHLEQLLRYVRGNALIGLIKPYRNVRIAFISDQLGMSEEEVENLLVSYILDGYIKGKIDQVNKVLRMAENCDNERYIAIDKWALNLSNTLASITL